MATNHSSSFYPPVEKEDEELIQNGLAKSDTRIDTEPSYSSSSEEEQEGEQEDEQSGTVESHFSPTRALYVLRHNLFSKEISIIDVTSDILCRYIGGGLTDDLRDVARQLTEDKTRTSNPAYQMQRKHWWNRESVMISNVGPESGNDIAKWKHPGTSVGKATLSFPSGSTHSAHDITISPVRRYRRTNMFVKDSVTYKWRCNSRFKANRLTLEQGVGGKHTIVGQYAQRWGSWIAGGLLLVDGQQVDEVVAVLTTCVMLRRMLQRAAERTKYCGAGGAGGGGG
jgi:hypothetical protein